MSTNYEARLQLSLLAYNLGNLWRRLVLPKRIDAWSLTSLQQRLVKTGGRLVKHARYYWLLLAESHLTRRPVRNDAPAYLGAASRNGLRRGECNKAAGRRKGSKGGWCPRKPRNGSSSRLQVSANEADGPLRAATHNFLRSEGPWVYKGAHPGDQNGNPS